MCICCCPVSGSNSSLNYAPNSPTPDTDGISGGCNTFFGGMEVPSQSDAESPNAHYEQEFERLVTPNDPRQTPPGMKACSQLGIMQPLEQLHTANLAFGIKLELFFEKIFRQWGTFVAKNPWSIIIASVLVSSYLAAGVYFNFQVTTDPVDLWVPLGSEARHDMEYFNNKFWKFYRIEQVLIAPKGMESFTGRDYTVKNENATRKYGPVFNQTFLLESFDLYQRIVNISASHSDFPDGIKLEDICYKPLGGQCATQSLFTYFHENVREIQNPNYLAQIQNCIE